MIFKQVHHHKSSLAIFYSTLWSNQRVWPHPGPACFKHLQTFPKQLPGCHTSYRCIPCLKHGKRRFSWFHLLVSICVVFCGMMIRLLDYSLVIYHGYSTWTYIYIYIYEFSYLVVMLVITRVYIPSYQSIISSKDHYSCDIVSFYYKKKYPLVI